MVLLKENIDTFEMRLTLMKQASLPMQYWSDVFFTSVFLINRLPSKALQNVSPHEILFLKTPDYDFLRVFGCLCFPLLMPFKKHKLEFRSAMCVFIGYCLNEHGYHFLYSPGRLYVSRHVRFRENVFPFAKSTAHFM